MKKSKLSNRILCLVLAFVMILGTCATTFASEPEKETIVYVSIGDSMTNGYGLDGYNGSSGIVNYANATYANQFAAWLAGYAGDIADDQVIFDGDKAVVDHRQLAMSGMRAEDVHWVLELDYTDKEFLNNVVNMSWNGNDWSNDRFNAERWYNEFGFAAGDYRTNGDVVDPTYRFGEGAARILRTYHDDAENAKYYQSQYATEDMIKKAVDGIDGDDEYPNKSQVPGNGASTHLQIGTEFWQKSVEDADIISLALGNTNFGTYMLNEIMDVTMYGDLVDFASKYDIENVFNLAGLDAETEAAVRDLIAECDVIIEQMFGTLAGGDQDKLEALRNIIVYCITSYAVNYIGAVEAILELNPDVDIIQIALMNAYADESEEITDTTLGDIVDVLYTPVNAFIAAVPTVMQGANRELYKDAKFYYAEADTVGCMVEVFGEDFYKNGDNYVTPYPGLLNGNEGYTGNAGSTVRDRFVENIVKGQTFGLINEIAKNRTDLAVATDLTVEEIMAYDIMTPTEKAAYAAAEATKKQRVEQAGNGTVYPNRALSCALYLAFENASIAAGKGTVTLNSLAALDDLEGAFGGIVGTLGEKAIDYGREKYSSAITAAIPIIVKTQFEQDASVKQILDNGLHTDLDGILACEDSNEYHAYCPGIKNTYDRKVTETQANPELIGTLCYLLGLPQTLSDAMVGNPTLSGMLCMNARCLIGTGIGGHPSEAGHDSVFAAVKNAYEGKHMAKDQTINNVTAFIKEYYDEAYALAYAEADKAGYVDKAAKAIDEAIKVITKLDLSETKITEEFREELTKELSALIMTLNEIKAALIEDKASDVEGLYNTAVALWDDLNTHLTNAGTLLSQAEFDVKTLLCPVIDAYIKTIIEEYVMPFVDETGDDLSDITLKKIDHKHYEKTDDSYYVAIGGDTVSGTNLDKKAKESYQKLIAEEYAVPNTEIAKVQLLSNEVLALVTENAAEIKKADLITYQLDATNFFWSTLNVDADWDKYINEFLTPEERELVEKIVDETIKVLTMDWKDHTDTKITELVEKIKVAVLSELPGDVPFVEDIFDALVDFLLPYIRDEIIKAEGMVSDELKLDKIEEINNTIASLDETTKGYIEKFAFAFVSYAAETSKAIEAIRTINPDATLVVVGMYNPFRGLGIKVGEDVINTEEYFEYVIDATNNYYSLLSMTNKGFAFVDVSDADTNGFNTTIDMTDKEEAAGIIGSMIFSIPKMMNANADGHEYIAKEVIKALTCDFGDDWKELDEDNHAKVCSICGYPKTEAHSFAGGKCVACGKKKSSGGSSGGGGGGGGFATGGKKEEDKTEGTTVVPSAPAFFFDVPADAWYYEVIKTAYEKGLMNGISETEFAPNQSLTRGMFVTILYRLAGSPEVTVPSSFADIPASQYYANAVAWASANGIVNGVSADKFAPNNNITREQMATMIYRYATANNIEAANKGEITFSDSAKISEFAKGAVEWASSVGVLFGNSDGTFAPLRTATRAEAAAIFVRLLGFIG